MSTASPTATNLLFITADEMRGDCLRSNGLNPDIRTPSLDLLAAQGTRFERHFATFPKCVPARISLTTGRYCHTDGFRDIHRHLPASHPDLLPSLLHAGYEVALFGKNHCWENILGASHTPPELPVGATGLRIAHHSWTSGFKEIYTAVQEVYSPSSAMRSESQSKSIKPFNSSWADEAYTRQAIAFIERARDHSRPFYLHVNLEAPHPYYNQPVESIAGEDFYDPDSLAPFPADTPQPASISMLAQRQHRSEGILDGGTLRRIQAAYYGMITRMDAQVGRIIDALDAAGLRESTLVVFLSDHGDFAGQYGLPEKWDTTFSDCLLHVPCILRGPSSTRGPTVPAGSVCRSLTDHTDIAPSLCALLGLPTLPGMHGFGLPGIAGNIGKARQAVFASGGHDRAMRARVDPRASPDGSYRKFATYQNCPESMARAMCVRTEGHKLVWRETGDHELYALESDRWELANRFTDASLTGTRTELMGLLLDWQLATWTDRPEQKVVGP